MAYITAESLQAKEAALPEEPPASAPDPLVTCVLRFPDGSRLARRFRTFDLLQSLFDFTDAKVHKRTPKTMACQGLHSPWQGVASVLLLKHLGSKQDDSCVHSCLQGSASNLAPGSYQLVAQMPRRVLHPSSCGQDMTLQQAGLQKGQEMLMLEPL